MNCTTCNTPLETNVRFCPRCGESVSLAAENNAPTLYQTFPLPDATILSAGLGYQDQAATILPGHIQLPPTQPLPLPSSPQPHRTQAASHYQAYGLGAGANIPAHEADKRPRRRRGGCLINTLITLIVLVALVIGAWFVVARPYLSSLAQMQLNIVLNNVVDTMPPQVAQAPPGAVVITEKMLNDLLVLESPRNDLVKNPQIHVTPNLLQMDFQVYGFTNTFTGVPQLQQGKLVMTQVHLDGIAGLILSDDDITAIANKHLADAQTRLNHSILVFQLKEHEVDMVLGLPSITLPTLP